MERAIAKVEKEEEKKGEGSGSGREGREVGRRSRVHHHHLFVSNLNFCANTATDRTINTPSLVSLLLLLLTLLTHERNISLFSVLKNK